MVVGSDAEESRFKISCPFHLYSFQVGLGLVIDFWASSIPSAGRTRN